MNQIPDTELIKKSIDGDGQAFAALIKRVETRLLQARQSGDSGSDIRRRCLAGGAVGCVAWLEAAAGLGALGRMGAADRPTPVLRLFWVGAASGGTDGSQRP